jgi:tetratricopeptide (TPR) repeat protein
LQGRPREARDIFERLIAKNRHYLEVYDWLARAHCACGDDVAAQEILKNAVKLSPKSVRRQRFLGETAQKNQQIDVAEQAFRNAIREGRNSCLAEPAEYVQLAGLLTAQGRSTQALGIFQDGRKAFRQNPGFTLRLAAEQAMFHYKQGQEADARHQLEEAQAAAAGEQDNLPADAAIQLARACFALGDRERAMALMRSAVRSSHDNEKNIALARSVFQEFSLGEEGRELIENNMKELIALNNRGVKLFQEDKVDEAVALFVKAADGLPQNKTVNLNAARILLHSLRNAPRNEAQLTRVREYLERVRESAAGTPVYEQAWLFYRRLVQAG